MAAPICTTDRVTLASSTQLLSVAPGELTADEVMRMPSYRWQPVVAGKRLPVDSTVRWLKIELTNSGNQTCQRWLVLGAPTLRDLSVYVPRESGWKIMHAGALYPVAEWALPERQPAFPVMLAPYASTTVLARVPAKGAVVAFAPALWAPESFQHIEVGTALGNGVVYGGVLLLLLVSLLLSYLYRRPQLAYMAFAVGFYAAHKAAETNYLYYYLWPDMPQLNMWLRYFFVGMFFAAACRYISTALQVRSIGRWWAHIFLAAQGGFVFFALFSSAMPDMVLMTRLLLRLDQVCRLLFVLVLAHGIWRGMLRDWFPSLLVGLVSVQGLLLYGHWFVQNVPSLNYMEVFASMVLGGGTILLATLVSQVYKGRRSELRTQAALIQQRATENERMERTVARRTAELGRALQARRQLLGRISHDLRSPLVSMLDSVRQWRSGDSRHDHPGLIERNAHQQMVMIDELLEFSRTELSELEPEPIPGYLYAFLNEVAEQAELAVERNGNRLQRDFAADLPALVSLDFHYLRRVLTNLLGNAGKFTERGTIRFAVTALPGADANDATRRLHFSIEDNGPGIGAAERERLLQPYARGASAIQAEGHGLGLAIVTQLLERLGGQLAIDDAPGGGSRIGFELAAAVAAESDLEPIIEVGETVTIDGAGRVILVVDDEPQQRDITCDLLDGYGFDSIAASDGAAALQILQTQPVDLVLTDQYMPGMDGWALLQALRKRAPELPVVLYSSVPPRPPKTSVLAVTFDAALLKPVSGATLVNQVATLAKRADDPAQDEPESTAEKIDISAQTAPL